MKDILITIIELNWINKLKDDAVNNYLALYEAAYYRILLSSIDN